MQQIIAGVLMRPVLSAIATKAKLCYLVWMIRDNINAYCASLPGAEVTDPWGGGHDVWKVGNKSFIIMGTQNKGASMKCVDAETARMLIDVGHAEKAPYQPRGGWVFLRFENLDEDEFLERIKTSYITVRKSLTKKFQATLAPVD